MTTSVAPFRLKPWFSERVWGKRDLRPWYESTGTSELVGEAWLTGPQCVVETGVFAGRTVASVATELGGEFPLLVKLLFPNEKLSVQVHPDDAQAQAVGEARGKTECWYVLEAEPGATVALGLKPGVGPAEVESSVADYRDGDNLFMRAVVASPDGRQMIYAERRGTDPEMLGEQLAQQLLEQGAGAILGLEEKKA